MNSNVVIKREQLEELTVKQPMSTCEQQKHFKKEPNTGDLSTRKRKREEEDFFTSKKQVQGRKRKSFPRLEKWKEKVTNRWKEEEDLKKQLENLGWTFGYKTYKNRRKINCWPPGIFKMNPKGEKNPSFETWDLIGLWFVNEGKEIPNLLAKKLNSKKHGNMWNHGVYHKPIDIGFKRSFPLKCIEGFDIRLAKIPRTPRRKQQQF